MVGLEKAECVEKNNKLTDLFEKTKEFKWKVTASYTEKLWSTYRLQIMYCTINSCNKY